MDGPISRAEHEEFVRRMDEANRRQDKRLDALEETTKQIHALTASVEKLALSVQNMVEEQKRHSERLETLEGRDGEQWRKVIGYILTAGVGAVVTAVLSKLGIF